MEDKKVNITIGSGESIGSIIAIVLSYMKWHSIGWAIIHGILGWIYVLYYVLTYM